MNIEDKAQSIASKLTYEITPIIDEDDGEIFGFSAKCLEMDLSSPVKTNRYEAILWLELEVLKQIRTFLNTGWWGSAHGGNFIPEPFIHNFYKVKKSCFNKAIFCGAGLHAVVAQHLLKDRLNYGFSILSGSQQNGGMGSEYSEDEADQSQKDLEAVAMDVIIALGLENRFCLK